ncbi:MAG: type IV pilus secretin PilQ [Bdellovibrionia bacterium]
MKKWLLLSLFALSFSACVESVDRDQISDVEVPQGEQQDSPDDNDLMQPDAAESESIEPDDVQGGDDLLADDQPPEPQAIESETQSATPPADAPAVKITGLDFKAKESGGTIIIRSTGQASYTTRSNEANQQFIIEVANADLPGRFKRPYNTKEFDGPISGIQAYQTPGTRTARFVVQLKESIDPFVIQDGNILRISANASGPGGSGEMGYEGGGSGSGGSRSGGGGGFTITSSEKNIDSRILSNRNLDEFLLGQSKFYGRRISFQIKDGDVRDVFNFLAEESGLNIILSDDVTGKVSVKLRKIPWDQALVTIMKSKGYGYVRQGNILRIAPLANLQKEADAARTVIESQNRLKPIRVRVFPVSYAKVKELEAQTRDFLSERGRVRADERTNSLIVNDIEDNLDRVAKLITILDTQTPQVLIEAKIVEARQSFSRRVGVNWNFSGTPLELTTNSSGAPVNFNLAGSVQQSRGASNGDLNLSLGTLDFFGDLSASLSLFELENLIKVISAPRIMTLNGQKAVIQQTTEVPIPTITASTQAGAAATVTFTFKPVSLLLDVTPQITADGGIVMVVKVKRDFLGSAGAGGAPPPINSREANTSVLINNGQTVVMGGIFQSDAVEAEEGVPFLRKVPVLGTLFKGNSQGKEKNELLIFLTPRIMNKEKAFRTQRSS